MEFDPLASDAFTFDHAYIALNTRAQPTVIVGDVDREYPLASVTKLLASYAILIAAEQGKLALDESVAPHISALNTAKHDVKPAAAGTASESVSSFPSTSSAHVHEADMLTTRCHDEQKAHDSIELHHLIQNIEGVTFRHLLAHASGVGPSLGAPIVAPEKRRIYTNFGFDVLALAVSSALGQPIQCWIAEQVFQPLGMVDARIDGSIAKDGVCSADSLGLFAAELLHPTLVSPNLLNKAVTVHYPHLPGVLPGFGRHADNTWGLGFEIKGSKRPHWLGDDFSPRSFGHFGQSGSFLYVDPDAGVAGVFLGAVGFSEIHAKIWPHLTNDMRRLSL